MFQYLEPSMGQFVWTLILSNILNQLNLFVFWYWLLIELVANKIKLNRQ